MNKNNKINRKSVNNRIDNFSKGVVEKFKDIKVDLYTIDSMIKYYIDEVMNPKLKINNEYKDVPVLYGNREKWTSSQKEGVIRDKKGQIQSPIILYKRTSMDRNESMPVHKFQADNPQLYYTIAQSYTKENKYSPFSAITGRKPKKIVKNIIIPDYVILEYSFIVQTDYIEQMNYLMELINFHNNSYWGNERIKFKTKIDGFSDTSEVSEAKRVISNEFTLVVNAYIIPDIYSKKPINTKSNTLEGVKVTFE